MKICRHKEEERRVVVAVGDNKAGYTATLVACGWAGAVIEEATGAFGQEQ